MTACGSIQSFFLSASDKQRKLQSFFPGARSPPPFFLPVESDSQSYQRSNISEYPTWPQTYPTNRTMRPQFPTLAFALLALTTALPIPDPKPNPELLFPPLSPTEPLSQPLYPRNATGVARVDGGTPVATAGGVLNAAAAEEANPRDDTATRAFTSAPIKSSSGQCLFVDPAAGDFRENLIPVQLKTCDGSAEQSFDIITKGKHNQAEGSMLVVSSVVCFFSLFIFIIFLFCLFLLFPGKRKQY